MKIHYIASTAVFDEVFPDVYSDELRRTSRGLSGIIYGIVSIDRRTAHAKPRTIQGRFEGSVGYREEG